MSTYQKSVREGLNMFNFISGLSGEGTLYYYGQELDARVPAYEGVATEE